MGFIALRVCAPFSGSHDLRHMLKALTGALAKSSKTVTCGTRACQVCGLGAFTIEWGINPQVPYWLKGAGWISLTLSIKLHAKP